MTLEEEELIQDSEEERENLIRSTQQNNIIQQNNNKKKEKEIITLLSSSDSEISNTNNNNTRTKDSTSVWFSNKTTTSPTKRRKTKSPPPPISPTYSSSPPVKGSLLLPTSHQPIASTSTLPSISTDFKIPKLPTTSKSNSSSSKKKVRTSSSQFTSAATLLKTSPKPSSASRYNGYTTTSTSGVQLKETMTYSSQSSEDESTSKNLPLPPRLDTTDITRILHSLPPLIRKPSSSTSTTNSSSSKRRKPWEITEIPLESINPEDLPGVDKMRSSLAQFKYRDTSTPITSASASTSTNIDATTEDFTLEDYLESVHHRTPSTTSSTSTTTITKMMNLSPPAPPLFLPHSSRIQILTTCPLCSIPWTILKTISTKSTHLRNCAIVHSYSSETVIILIENWILDEGKKLELERRERERNKSLFDRVVGKGEGKSKWREVEAVGVGIVEEGESVAGGAGVIRKRQEDKKRVEELQKELEASFKKEPVDKLVKIANEIKLARKEEEECKIALRKQKELEEDEMELEYWQDEDLVNLPRPTGRLEVHSTARKAAVVIRANKVLGGKGGTGLTQLPKVSTKNKKLVVPRGTLITPSLYPPTASTSQIVVLKDNIMQIDESDQDLPLALPPSTQIFEPSKLAQRLVESGSIQGVLVPSKGLQRSLSPSTTTCINDNIDRERSSSLWAAASGIDNEIIEKVVRSSSTSIPPSSPSSQLFGTYQYQNQRSPPHPSSSTTVFNSSPLLTPQKRHPHLFPSSATSISSSSTNSKSNYNSPSSPTLRITTITNNSDSDDDDDNNSSNENSSPIKIISPLHNKNLSLQRLVPIDLQLNLPLLEKNQLLGSAVEDLLDSSSSEEEQEEQEEEDYEAEVIEVRKGKGKEVIEIDSSSEEEDEEQEERRGEEGWNDGEDGGDGMLVWNGADDDQAGRSSSEEESDEDEEEEIIIVTTKEKDKKGKATVVVLEDKTPSPSISSSEAEPLAQVILKSAPKPLRKPKSIKKSKSKSKINSPPPPSEAQLLGAPDYTTLTTVELQTKVKKYGFKVSKERSVLVDQLEKVWLALNGSKGVVGGGEKEKKVRKKKVVEVEEGEEEEAVEVRIRKLILAEENLYLKVLRYEPIFLEDFVDLITTNGIKLARPSLMKILDEMCITIYTQDPAAGTNKPRTRHR